ncbi:O-antigen polymerase [Vibrio cyclitrophicus]
MEIDKILCISLLLVQGFLVWKIVHHRMLRFSILWIIFWLLVACLNLFKSEFYPSTTVILFLVFTSIVACLGSVSQASLFDNINIENQYDFLAKTSKLAYIIIIPVMSLLAFKSISLLQTINIYDFRREVYSSSSGILPAGFLPIYTLLIGGLYKFSLFTSIYLFINGRGRINLFLPVVTTLLSCVITLGRFPLYEITLILMLALYYKRMFNLKILICGVFVFLALITFSIFRSGSYYGLSSIIQRHILGYHTYGFYLLEHKLTSIDLLNDSWLGMASSGSFGYFLTLPITWVSNFVSYMQSSYFLHQDQFVNVGSTFDGTAMYANAFYTLLYEPILDFGYLGVVMIGVLIGIVFRYFCVQESRNVMAGIILLYTSSILIGGIMKSAFIRHDIILPTVLFGFIFYLFKSKENLN